MAIDPPPENQDNSILEILRDKVLVLIEILAHVGAKDGGFGSLELIEELAPVHWACFLFFGDDELEVAEEDGNLDHALRGPAGELVLEFNPAARKVRVGGGEIEEVRVDHHGHDDLEQRCGKRYARDCA